MARRGKKSRSKKRKGKGRASASRSAAPEAASGPSVAAEPPPPPSAPHAEAESGSDATGGRSVEVVDVDEPSKAAEDDPGVGDDEAPLRAVAEDVHVFDLDAIEDDGEVVDFGIPEEGIDDFALDSPEAEGGKQQIEAGGGEPASAHEVVEKALAEGDLGGSGADDEPQIAPTGEAASRTDSQIDLGQTSTPEARARLLAETMAHAEMQEARYRVPLEIPRGPRRKATAALAIFTLAGVIAIAPPALLVPDRPAQLEAGERRRGVLLTLMLQAEQIEAYRAREQSLPPSLDDMATRLPGVRYVRSSNRLYQLIAYSQDGGAVVYDSAAPAPEFDRIDPVWQSGGGR